MSVFEIMGPIMIGPSSSHTAGAAKIGRLAWLLFKDKMEEVNVYFHGSFAETHQGHGTSKAIVGGILGFKPDDERLKNSLEIASKQGIKVNFAKVNLRNVHPNTVLLEIKGKNESLSLVGSSVGGGNIVVSNIDSYEVNITGKLPTLWLLHDDKPGEVGIITSILGSYQINIAFMRVFRKKKGTIGSSIIEMDQEMNEYIIKHLASLSDIIRVRYIPPLV